MLAEHGATAAVLAKLLADADKLHAGELEGHAACPTADGSADGDWTSGAISTATQTNLRDALPRVLAGMATDVCGAWAGEEAAAAGRACAALLRATPPARQFAPLYLCRVLVGSEAFAVAWLDGDPRVSPRVGALEILLGGALADGSPASAKSARVLGLTSLANLAGAPHG